MKPPAGRFRVLVVDDEERIRDFLATKLQVTGYDVITASNGSEALEQAQTQAPDLIVLDLILPVIDGLEALKRLRTFSKVPVVILSARGADQDRIKGLALGADDYIAKPFNPDELVARIEAIRRRLEPASNEEQRTITLGHVSIDYDRRRVVVSGRERYFTRVEWLLLMELSSNAGRLMPYDVLLTRVWGPEYRDDMPLLRTWMSRLRLKLEGDPTKPKLIRNVTKTGYVMGSELPEEPAAALVPDNKEEALPSGGASPYAVTPGPTMAAGS